MTTDSAESLDVAVIGFSARVPGANDADELWSNLRAGRESITFFGREELVAAGVSEEILNDSSFVPAGGRLELAEAFDAEFFGMSQREAELTDPQHRILLECCWRALEHAGRTPTPTPRIGVYAGCAESTYMFGLLSQPNFYTSDEGFRVLLGNEKDFLATRVAYKLGLTGPCLSVQTACSTGLVAVHVAVQALLAGECEMALAGGVSVIFPQDVGYVHRPGVVASPDGHCRAFDAKAAGTVLGNGAGVVVLRRLEDALSDGDRVYAVIRGSAVNNDGTAKVSFTAPSPSAQSEVVRTALRVAGVPAASIDYIEAHGTGTPLGDPIEIEALKSAFAASGATTPGTCALGSIKTNIGHLNTAAGIAGLIKVILALVHEELPPSLHFTTPNPALELTSSPFFVNDRLRPWVRGTKPRRAGVSSFGIGGTNAHVIVQEAPPRAPVLAHAGYFLCPVSARSEAALRTTHGDLADWVERAEPRLPDVAFTLQTGRRAFPWRSATIVSSTAELACALRDGGSAHAREAGPVRVAMMFPGQGAQHVGMACRVFEHSEVFRRAFERCSELFAQELGLDLARALFGDERETRAADAWPTTLTQAAVFSVDYALAQWWLSLGIRPAAVLGHSLGEYVAACVAGVFELKTAISLVVMRSRLMERAAAGAMLSVRASEADVLSLVAGQSDVSLAAVNAPNACVLSGSPASIERCSAAFQERGIATQRLAVAKAFHSALMEPLLPEFTAAIRALPLESPRLPIVSSATGQLLTAAQATNPAYWSEQLRRTVRFADAVQAVSASANLLLEVGPDRQLTACARQTNPGVSVVASSPRAGSGEDDQACLLAALGELWKAGVEPRWEALSTGSFGATRVAAPGHRFERRRYWISPSLPANRSARDAQPAAAIAPAAPDAVRQRIRELWVEALGASADETRDFFAAGGESLTASQLVSCVNRDLGLGLSVQDLFAAPTLAGLTDRALGSASKSDVRPRDDQHAAPVPNLILQDLRREVAFSPEPEPRRSVLLTGGTGFLGSYLLHELLERTQDEVVCLVRAESQLAGLERLRRVASERGIWNAKHEQRIRVALGDVAEEQLGLTEPEYRRLTGDVAAVYHAAAQVNFLFPYEALREVNVLGVERALRFSCEGRAKTFHYMSSTALFEAPECVELGSVREDTELPAQLSLPTGYQRSKWVAETLVRRASERGVKTVIYRVGSLWGDSQSGDCNLSDFSLRMLAGCASLGAAPELAIAVQPAPVDVAVAAIVRLSRELWQPGRVFHVVGPEPLPFKSLVEWVRALGYPIDCEPYDGWRQRARPNTAQKALEPFEPILGERFRPAWPRVECGSTRAEIQRLGGELRSVTPADLGLYLRFFEQNGLALKLPSTQKGNAMMQDTTEGKIWDVPFRLGLYDIWTPLNFDRSIQESVRSVLVESQGHVLDIGCGTGRSLLFAQDWLKNGGRLTGLDISPGGLHAARARAKALSIEHKVTLVEGDMQRMTDVLQGPFDGAISHFSVYTLPSAEGRRRVFAQAAQLIKSGGRFCVTVPGERYTGSSLVRDARPLERQRNKKSLRDRIVREWLWLPFLEVATKRFVERRLDAGVFHRFGADELKSELEQAGFRDVSIAPVATMGAYSAVGIR